MRSRSRRWAAAALCLLAAMWLAGCHLQPRLDVAPLPAWDAAFDRSSGWVGGDGAYSTALGRDRTLWLFGDTFVGRVEGGRRVASRLIANSLAVQRDERPSPGFLEFFYRTDGGSLPQPAFTPPTGTPGSGPGTPCGPPRGSSSSCCRSSAPTRPPPSASACSPCRSRASRTPMPPPAAWRAELRPVPWTSGQRLLGSSVLTVGGVCYIYGTIDDPVAGPGRRQAIVARVAAERLWDFAEWRFFAGGGWVAEAGRAVPVCADAAPEFSVSYQAGIGRYVMVHSAAGLSPEMVVRYAAAPEGPWSAPVRFFSCPEAAWDPRVFCYAAKGHPEVEPSPDALTVTYVANATELALVEADARLYRPRFLRLRFSPGPLF